MENNKYTRLMDQLIFKSGNRELEWKEGVHPEALQLSFANYSITLAPLTRDNQIDYVVSIIDSDGNTIDTFSDMDLGGDYFTKMHELYQNARRQALGVDKALDEILEELGDPF